MNEFIQCATQKQHDNEPILFTWNMAKKYRKYRKPNMYIKKKKMKI